MYQHAHLLPEKSPEQSHLVTFLCWNDAGAGAGDLSTCCSSRYGATEENSTVVGDSRALPGSNTQLGAMKHQDSALSLI